MAGMDDGLDRLEAQIIDLDSTMSGAAGMTAAFQS